MLSFSFLLSSVCLVTDYAQSQITPQVKLSVNFFLDSKTFIQKGSLVEAFLLKLVHLQNKFYPKYL